MQISEIKIEKGIVLEPTPREIEITKWKNHVATMEVGDSILLPADQNPSLAFEAMLKTFLMADRRDMETGETRLWRTR